MAGPLDKDQHLQSLVEEATCPLTLGPPRAPMAGPPEATCPLTLGPPTAPMAGPPEQDQRWLSLAEEATCPICLEYFEEPVSVQCGHTFCSPCITRYWEGVQDGQGPYPCPQCWETAPTNTLRPIRQLASIAQIVARGPPVAPHMCTEHDEKLKLFCHEDQRLICVICRESREHRGHTMTPIQEAAEEYKQMFQRHLDDETTQRENILGLLHKEEEKLTDLEVNFKIYRVRIISVFNEVQQFLEKEMFRHLSNLEEREKKTLQRMRVKVSKLDKKQASLRDQIKEIEAKCQQPDLQLLKDVKSILSRFEKMKCQPPDSGNVKDKVKAAERNEDGVQEMVEDKEMAAEAKDVEGEAEEEDDENEEQLDAIKKDELVLKIINSLVHFGFHTGHLLRLGEKFSLGKEWRRARSYSSEVTLDPDTAHPKLILSEDRKSVRLGDLEQDLPDTPKRFNTVANVLGRLRMSSGKHYWEVEVGDKTIWYLGVCDESVSRKGKITPLPEDGYWAVWLRDGEYKACTSQMTPLTPCVPPRVVGLFLDYEVGWLSVYNVTGRSLLYIFSEDSSFPRTLRPFFGPGTKDEGKNEGALRVLPVTGQE